MVEEDGGEVEQASAMSLGAAVESHKLKEMLDTLEDVGSPPGWGSPSKPSDAVDVDAAVASLDLDDVNNQTRLGDFAGGGSYLDDTGGTKSSEDEPPLVEEDEDFSFASFG